MGRRSHDRYAVVGMTALCRVPDYAAPKIRSRWIALNSTPEKRFDEIELIVSLDGIAAFPNRRTSGIETKGRLRSTPARTPRASGHN